MSSSMARRKLETECLMSAARLVRLLEANTDARYATAGLVGITSARASVLHVLFSSERGKTAQQVALEIGVSKVTASRLVRALEKGGWLTRRAHPQDRRAFELRLTPKARRVFPKLVEIHNQTLDMLFDRASGAQLERLLLGIENSLTTLRRRQA